MDTLSPLLDTLEECKLTWEEKRDLKLSFPAFALIAHHYVQYLHEEEEEQLPLGEEETYAKEEREREWQERLLKDTVEINEDLDNYLHESVLEIVPKDPSDRSELFYAIHERIGEVYEPQKPYTSELLEEWQKQRIEYENVCDYQRMHHACLFCFRPPDRDEYFTKRLAYLKTTLGLRDTSVHIFGESGFIANLVYKGRLSASDSDYILFRIERRHQNKLLETKYVRFWFNKTC